MLVKFLKGGAYLLRKCTGVNQGWRGGKGRRRRDKEEKKTHANMEEEEEKSLAAVRATRKREEDGKQPAFLGGRLHRGGVESSFGILGMYNELAFVTL